MATWRRRALELFPELRNDLNRRDYTTYDLFRDLRRRAWEAHDSEEVEALRKIYGFAEWCLMQRSKALWNPAGVSFYEHMILDRREPKHWSKVLPWLSPRVIDKVWPLWEWMLGDIAKQPDEVEVLREMVEERRRSG